MAFACLLLSCNENQQGSLEKSGEVLAHFKSYESLQLATQSGKLIKAYIAKSEQQQTQGLSGVKPSEIADNEAMLFVYDSMGPRSFWMPNTFTNLDIFFLDGSYSIVHVERDVPAHPGMKEPPRIARTPVVMAKYVLELAASSSLSKEIKTGQIIKPLNP